MKEFEYDAFNTKSLSMSFKCPRCGESIEDVEVYVPKPNLAAEKNRESQSDDSEIINCDKCNEEFDVFLSSSLGGGYGEISIPDEGCDFVVTENYEDYIDDHIETI